MDEQKSSSKMSPKDFFLYLGILITLYISAGSLLALWFRIIDIVFRDAVEARDVYYQSFYYYTGGMRFAIASLVVIFPIYLFISWILRKGIIIDPNKADLSVRKWFVYLTLFVAGATAIGDLITVLNQFLGGEITVRFILKAVAVLVVALGVFGYYLYDLRRTDTVARKSFVLVSAFLVLASLIVGFVVMGSPSKQRDYRFDDQRVGDLQSIQWQVLEHWQRTRVLPTTLNVLTDALAGSYVPTDPKTKEQYEYRVTNELSFELCATFAQERKNIPVSGYRGGTLFREEFSTSPSFGGFSEEEQWDHGVGRTCFTRTIDPTRYPPVLPIEIPIAEPIAS